LERKLIRQTAKQNVEVLKLLGEGLLREVMEGRMEGRVREVGE